MSQQCKLWDLNFYFAPIDKSALESRIAVVIITLLHDSSTVDLPIHSSFIKGMNLKIHDIEPYKNDILRLYLLDNETKNLTDSDEAYELIQYKINNIVADIVCMNYNEFIHSLDVKE